MQHLLQHLTSESHKVTVELTAEQSVLEMRLERRDLNVQREPFINSITISGKAIKLSRTQAFLRV